MVMIKKEDGYWYNIIEHHDFFDGTKECISCRYHYLTANRRCPDCGGQGKMIE